MKTAQSIKGHTNPKLSIKSILAPMAVICTLLLTLPVNAQASEKEENVKQGTLQAVRLLENAIENSFDQAEKEIKQFIVEEGADYYLTMESFYRQENPYKDADYLGLIAAYMAAKNYGDTLQESDFYSLPFIRAKIEKRALEEYQPVLAWSYKETGDGRYARDRQIYIEEPMETDSYRMDEEGMYVRDGTEKIIPEKKTVLYGEITLEGLRPEDILAYYELSENRDAYKDAQEKCVRLGHLVNGKGLKESVFLNIGQNLVTEEMIQYVDMLLKEDMNEARKALIQTAVQLVGKVPYEWGGKAQKAGYDTAWWSLNGIGIQKGLDCSGFVQWCFVTAGFDDSICKTLISTEEILKNTSPVSEDELQPGDIGLINHGDALNHTGIYLGEGYWIHCSSKAGTVILEKTDMFRVFREMPQGEGVMAADELLAIPEETDRYGEQRSEIIAEGLAGYNSDCGYSEEDIYLLAQLINNEADGEGMNGWIAVAEVVLNRVVSDRFPDTVPEVIYQKNPVQFADNQRIITRRPSKEQVFVAREVLSGNLGVLNNRNALFFRNAGGLTSDWGDYSFFISINNHQFYLDDEKPGKGE